jgi:cytochrome c553
MKTSIKTFVCLSLGLFALVSSPVYSADTQAGGKKAAQCASCHGAKGISSNGQNPNLAGQSANYLAAQLNAFKDGSRVNPVMQGIVANLTEAEIDSLADFFAGLPNDTVNTKAKVAAEASSKFAMCASCHGSAGEGRGAVPKVANQNADYLAAQLNAFKKGTRKGPMAAMAKNLSEEDIKTLSTYMSSLKSKE